ncbi:MAG: hypothetical protein LRY40_00015 [Shewanella fodinae]|nr:hypothetical protein [Shewanella fodinae]
MSVSILSMAKDTLKQTNTISEKPTIHIEQPADSIQALLVQLLEHVDVSFGDTPIDLTNQTLGICQEIGVLITTVLDYDDSGISTRALSVLSHEQFLQSMALEAVANVRVRTD